MVADGLLAEKVAPALGVVIANALFASPFKAVLAVRQSGDIQELNSLPFVFIVGNCTSWLAYSYVTRDVFVFLANLFGAAMGVFYVTICQRCDKREVQDRTTAMLTGLVLLHFTLGFVTVMGIDDRDDQKLLWGLAANTILIFFYCSPLATLFEVIRTSHSGSLHLPLCFMNIVNGVLWLIYGLAMVDPWIAVPNGIGAVLGVVQVSLCCIYPRKKLTKSSSREQIISPVDGVHEALRDDAQAASHSHHQP